MCDYTNERDSNTEFLQSIIEMKDSQIVELKTLLVSLNKELKRLKEYEWMYMDLCQ